MQILIALVAAAFIGLTAVPVTAQEFSFGPHGFGFGEHHHWHPGGGHWEGDGYGYGYRPHYRGGYGGGSCRELRAACMHKEELGEVGRGNCRRYRETCG